jgi:MazG family protein
LNDRPGKCRLAGQISKTSKSRDELMTEHSSNNSHDDAFSKMVGLIETLRSENGCPWDKKQTPESFHPYILEEYHEMVQAISSGDHGEIADELGDLIFQVVYVAYMFEELGVANISEVINGVVKKMIYRHPHVFGDVQVSSSEEVMDNWVKIKATEKHIKKRESILDGVPRSLPSLLRAQQLSKRAAKVGFDWMKAEEVFVKIEEELQELKEAVVENSSLATLEEMGDLLFVIVNASRHLGINTETALSHASDKFERRFRYIENRLQQQSRTLEQTNMEEMDRLWDEAKNREKRSASPNS